jgi:zinc transporter ZupT
MTPTTTLIVSMAILAAASGLGGWLAALRGLGHRPMQFVLSFVAGLLGGLAALVLLPEAASHTIGIQAAMGWATAGFVGIIVLERLVCFHHHETPGADAGHECCGHDHGPRLATPAAFAGLAVHGALAGLALGVAIATDTAASWPAGVFLLAIALHKPFDGLTVVAVARRDGCKRSTQLLLNAAYALVTPLAVLIGFVGAGQLDPAVGSAALAIAAGLLLALALGDLLPEVQSHDHDRFALTLMLILGLGAAAGIGVLHDAGHVHDHEVAHEHEAAHVHDGHVHHE